MPAKVIIICGPTSTGKTSLALEIAEKYQGQLVSFDSRQVYKHLDIVTGKDIPENFYFQLDTSISDSKVGCYTNGKVSIWGYDLVNPDQQLTVNDFVNLIIPIINHLWAAEKTPILVGGSGFYLKCLTTPPLSFGCPPDYDLRQSFSKYSIEELQKVLLAESPHKFQSLNNSERHNPHRLIRAIEIIRFRQSVDPRTPTNSSITEFTHQLEQAQVLTLGLTRPRASLYDHIDQRVFERFCHSRLIDELDYLLNNNYLSGVPATTIGYQQLIAWMNSELNLQDSLSQWQYAEHAYARRQMTWFKKNSSVNWFDVDSPDFKKSVDQLIYKWYTRHN